MSVHDTPTRRALLAPLALLTCIGFLALGGCDDRELPTALGPDGPTFTQVSTNPVVNSLADDGDGTCDDVGTGDGCTLREAIDFATSGATITFASEVTGTITLESGNLSVNKSLTITGPGATTLAVSGGNATTLFWIVGGTSTISGLTLRDGSGMSNGGGALYVSNAGTVVTLQDCVMTNNSAGPDWSDRGGAIFISAGDLRVSSSTLYGNTAPYDGEAIYLYDGSLTLLNSTITGNDATGDAVYVYGGTARIDHSTITANGGGVLTRLANVYVKGSIISGNTSYDVGVTGETGAFSSLGYNLVGTSDTNVDVLPRFGATGDQTGITDAKLGALAMNAPGTTPTHALLDGSAAIDAGVCTDIGGNTLATDQRGVSRPQGSACDIGAYELEPSGTGTPTFTFDLATLPPKTYGDPDFDVSGYVTTNSTGDVTFDLGSGSVGCSVTTAGMVTITGAATGTSYCILEATLAPDDTYTGAGPESEQFNIAKAQTTVAIANMPTSAAVGGGFTATYTTDSDGATSVTSKTPGVCTVSGDAVSLIGSGTCTLYAFVAEGTNWEEATGSDQSVTVSAATPTFTFDLSTLPDKTYGDDDFDVSGYVTTNSTGEVTFALGSGSVGCSVTSAGLVTITGAAVDLDYCILDATLAPDDTYAGAGPESEQFNIARAATTVTIANMPTSAVAGGGFTPTYTTDSDGATSVTSKTTGVCTVSGDAVSFIGTGTCTLYAFVAEGTNWEEATGSDQSVAVDAATPTFTFDLSGLSKTYGDSDFSVAGSPYVTTNSTGEVTFALGAGSVGCSVTSAGMVTITGAAVDLVYCILEATLAPDDRYAGAGPESEQFNIAKAETTVTIANMPTSATVGGGFTPTYTTDSDGAASVVSNTTGVCTVSGGAVSFDAEGDCILVASVAEGTNWLPETGDPQSVTVTVGPVFTSACVYEIHPKNERRIITVTWDNAEPGVTLIRVGNGKDSDRQLSPTASGSWTTGVGDGDPTYGLWGGEARRDFSTEFVPEGTACTLQH